MRYKISVDILIKIMENNGSLLKDIEKFYNRKELKSITKSAVKQNGMALMYAPDFQNNKEIVLTAIKQNSLAFYFASPKLQKDKEVLTTYHASVKRFYDEIYKETRN